MIYLVLLPFFLCIQTSAIISSGTKKCERNLDRQNKERTDFTYRLGVAPLPVYSGHQDYDIFSFCHCYWELAITQHIDGTFKHKYYICIPGTQMSLVLIGKDLLLEAKQRTNGFQVYILYFMSCMIQYSDIHNIGSTEGTHQRMSKACKKSEYNIERIEIGQKGDQFKK